MIYATQQRIVSFLITLPQRRISLALERSSN